MTLYNEIINTFEDLVGNHRYYRGFGHGSIEKIDAVVNHGYPLLFIRPLSSPGLTGVDGRQRELVFEIYSLDVPKLSDEDGRLVMSNTEQGLYDVYAYILDGPVQYDLQITMTNLVPLYEAFQDRALGWLGTFTVITDADGITYCNIPGNPTPTPTATPTSTPTPTASSTPTPTPTASSTPTATPTATPEAQQFALAIQGNFIRTITYETFDEPGVQKTQEIYGTQYQPSSVPSGSVQSPFTWCGFLINSSGPRADIATVPGCPLPAVEPSAECIELTFTNNASLNNLVGWYYPCGSTQLEPFVVTPAGKGNCDLCYEVNLTECTQYPDLIYWNGPNVNRILTTGSAC